MATADDDATPINDPEQDIISDQKPHTTTLDGSVFPQCVKPLSRQFLEVTLIFRMKAKKACLTRETEGKQRMRRDRDGSVISVGESMSRTGRRHSMRSHSHQTQREFHSSERDLREHLERRAQQAIHGENSVRRKLNSTEYNMQIQSFEQRNSEYASLESQRELESRRQQLMMVNHSVDHAQRERVHLCSGLEMRSHLRQEGYARSCQEIQE